MQETILGMQSGGVQANAKHYIGNEQVSAVSLTAFFLSLNVVRNLIEPQ
jgi:beta-glucosidase-like glycosyl hydrolase